MGFISKVFGVVSTAFNTYKIYFYLAAALAALGGAVYIRHQVYESGYDAAMAEVKKIYQKELNEKEQAIETLEKDSRARATIDATEIAKLAAELEQIRKKPIPIKYVSVEGKPVQCFEVGAGQKTSSGIVLGVPVEPYLSLDFVKQWNEIRSKHETE